MFTRHQLGVAAHLLYSFTSTFTFLVTVVPFISKSQPCNSLCQAKSPTESYVKDTPVCGKPCSATFTLSSGAGWNPSHHSGKSTTTSEKVVLNLVFHSFKIDKSNTCSGVEVIDNLLAFKSEILYSYYKKNIIF